MTTSTNEWMSAQTWAALVLGGPEIDYGVRWGTTRATRVSFMPFREAGRVGRGVLYAHDIATDRYLILAPDVRLRAVEAAWQRVLARHVEPTDLTELSRLLPGPTRELAL